MTEPTKEETSAYEDFKRRYQNCRSDYEMMCVLSGYMRQLEKRCAKANARADQAERDLKNLRTIINSPWRMGGVSR